MALTRTRLYYGTGFGVGDTPYYSSILDTASYRDFESHFDLQELFLTSIRLKATYDQVESADYLRFGSAYYWITGISMINVNTAELYLELDACATCHGIGNIDFVEGEGIIERAHPLHDGDFENNEHSRDGKESPDSGMLSKYSQQNLLADSVWIGRE